MVDMVNNATVFTTTTTTSYRWVRNIDYEWKCGSALQLLHTSVSDIRIISQNFRQSNYFDKFHKFRSLFSIENKASLCKHFTIYKLEQFFKKIFCEGFFPRFLS